MTIIRVEIAGPPMAKGRARFTKTGHAFTPQRTVNYESMVAQRAGDVMNGRAPLEGPLRVVMTAYMAIAPSKPARFKADAMAGRIMPTKKPDWDNFGKILDALNMIVWVDDAQIIDGRVLKKYSDRPRMEIEVSTVETTGLFA